MAPELQNLKSMLHPWLRLSLIAGIFCATLHAGIFTEEIDLRDTPPAPKRAASKKKKGSPARRLASAEASASYQNLRVRNGTIPAERNVELQAGLEGGYAAISGSSVDSAGQTTGNFSDKNISAGLSADLRAWKYFGAEAEGFAGFGSSTSDPDSRQLYGGLLNLKGQLPFSTGSIRWIPKLGLGYGLIQLNASNESSDAANAQTDTTRLTGPVAVAGLEVEPFKDWVFSVDYARSLSAQGTFSTQSGGISDNESSTGNSFDRIRVGAYYRVAPHFVVGGQFIRRSLSYTLPQASGPTEPNPPSFSQQFQMSQGLALFLYEL